MKDKFSKFSLPLLWFFAFIVIIFLIAFTSHAEDSYFPMQQNENGNIPQYIIDYFNDNYSDDYFIVLRWWGHNASFNEDYIYYLMFPKSNDFMLYGEIFNNGYQFSLYNVGNNIGGLSNGYMGFRNGSQSDYWNGGQNITGWQSLNSSLYDSGTDFVSNFKIWTSSNESNRSVVLKYGSDEIPVEQGHATPPNPFESPTLATGSNHTLPREVPESPTINYYTWTIYNNPSVDNSSTDALLESIIDILSYNAGYLTTNISNEFDNLITNIKGFFDYVSETIQYYCGLIISNIQNGIDTLYNNMVSLIEPIYDKFVYFTEPFDSDTVSAAFTSTNFYGIKNLFVSTFTTFDNAFDITEPDSFTVIFNVQNITPLYDLGVRSPVTVDLGVNFLPIRAALRTFLWILVTFGSVFVVEHGLSNWLRGARKE